MKFQNTVSEAICLANDMAKKKKGSLFIISKRDISKHYDLLYPELFEGKTIKINDFSFKPVLLKLADLDGAIIADDSGNIKGYGAKIKRTKHVLLGHGTRHAAGLSASTIPDTMAVLSSEEDGMVRIFKNGKLAAELNPETGQNKNLVDKMSEAFSKSDVQVATSSGVASLLLGLNPLMAGAVFTGSYIITKYGLASIKDFVKTGKIIISKK